MKWGYILAGMLLLSLTMGIANASLPQVGDTVLIVTQYTGLSFLWMIGNITDLDDSTICLDCLKAESVDGSGNPGPHVDHDILGEICLGKSSYLYLKVVPEELKEEAIDSLEN